LHAQPSFVGNVELEDTDVKRDPRIAKFDFHVHGKKLLYSPVSLGCLPESNAVRQIVVWVIASRAFEHLIFLLILANSVIMAMSDYRFIDLVTGDIVAEGSTRNEFVLSMDPVFVSLFCCEAVLKIVGMGFWTCVRLHTPAAPHATAQPAWRQPTTDRPVTPAASAPTERRTRCPRTATDKN
jgi:hypothetical protein